MKHGFNAKMQRCKANRFEAELLSGQRIITPQDTLLAATQIRERGDFPAVIVTLDQDGCVLAQSDGRCDHRASDE